MFAKFMTYFINILFKRQQEPTQAYTETKYPYKNTLTMATVHLYILDRYLAQKYWVDAKYLWERYGTESFTEYWHQLKVDMTTHGVAYLEVFDEDDYSEFFLGLFQEGWTLSTPHPTGIVHFSKLIFEKHDVTPNYG